jgi:hypothetical protein
MMETPIRIGVVGAGPRGTIMVGRLCANAAEIAGDRPVIVHLIDPYLSGGGRVWNTGQHRGLLMNTVTGDVTVFTDKTVTCAGPLHFGPTLYQWARLAAAGEVPGLDDGTVAEATQLKPWSYASRAFQGSYLRWALHHFIDNAPAQIRVELHEKKAVRLEDGSAGRQLVWLDNEPEPLELDSVVLNQGHFDISVTPSQAELSEFADQHDIHYLPPANPAETDLSAIPAAEPVILRGLGLNFFDYLILLTVGRGGRFERMGDRLVYHRSGQEPVLYAGSGRGVPYHARAETFEEVVPRYQPTFLDAAAIERLRADAGSGRLDFRAGVWPLVAKEAAWVYYRSLLSQRDPAGLRRFESEYPALNWGSEALDKLITELVPDERDRWSWDDIDRPAEGLSFTDRASYSAWIRTRLEDDYRHSKLGPAGSARKATAAMMRDLRDEVRQVISHRGLSGESYRRHIDGWFSGMNNFVASGPPASRIQELAALVDAGLVVFIGPGMRVRADEDYGRFEAESPVIEEPAVVSRWLIEAHLPLTDLRRTVDPLLRGLLRQGECRPHEIPNADGGAYQTGGLDITPVTQQLVRADGTCHPSRFCYGPPVESVQWVTAIGARPHVNSRTLLQADIIARESLGNGTTSAGNTAASDRLLARTPA